MHHWLHFIEEVNAFQTILFISVCFKIYPYRNLHYNCLASGWSKKAPGTRAPLSGKISFSSIFPKIIIGWCPPPSGLAPPHYGNPGSVIASTYEVWIIQSIRSGMKEEVLTSFLHMFRRIVKRVQHWIILLTTWVVSSLRVETSERVSLNHCLTRPRCKIGTSPMRGIREDTICKQPCVGSW